MGKKNRQHIRALDPEKNEKGRPRTVTGMMPVIVKCTTFRIWLKGGTTSVCALEGEGEKF